MQRPLPSLGGHTMLHKPTAWAGWAPAPGASLRPSARDQISASHAMRDAVSSPPTRAPRYGPVKAVSSATVTMSVPTINGASAGTRALKRTIVSTTATPITAAPIQASTDV